MIGPNCLSSVCAAPAQKGHLREEWRRYKDNRPEIKRIDKPFQGWYPTMSFSVLDTTINSRADLIAAQGHMVVINSAVITFDAHNTIEMYLCRSAVIDTHGPPLHVPSSTGGIRSPKTRHVGIRSRTRQGSPIPLDA